MEHLVITVQALNVKTGELFERSSHHRGERTDENGEGRREQSGESKEGEDRRGKSKERDLERVSIRSSSNGAIQRKKRERTESMKNKLIRSSGGIPLSSSLSFAMNDNSNHDSSSSSTIGRSLSSSVPSSSAVFSSCDEVLKQIQESKKEESEEVFTMMTSILNSASISLLPQPAIRHNSIDYSQQIITYHPLLEIHSLSNRIFYFRTTTTAMNVTMM